LIKPHVIWQLLWPGLMKAELVICFLPAEQWIEAERERQPSTCCVPLHPSSTFKHRWHMSQVRKWLVSWPDQVSRIAVERPEW